MPGLDTFHHGRALIHQIIWYHVFTFQDSMVSISFANMANMSLFESYIDDSSVKDMTHLRRGTSTLALQCGLIMTSKVKKDVLLLTKSKKLQFVQILSRCLERESVCPCHR